MNDRQTLDCYARLLIFKEDKTQSYINYGPPLSGSFRKVVHELAQHLGLHHMSVGSGEDRHVHISKEKLESRSQYPVYSNDSNRRGLARAATMDFNDARESGYHGLRPQNSARLDVPSSPSLGGLGGQRSLREAKSFGDLQARTASPALSSSSFPAALLNNVRAYPEYSMMNGTPASNTWDESALNSSIANLNLGFGGHASNPRLNGRNGMNSDSHNTNAGAIGSQRGVTGHAGSYDDAPRNGASAVPAERQPRGPPHDWGSGFARPRQNANPSRGFGDLDNHEPDQASDHDNSRFM